MHVRPPRKYGFPFQCYANLLDIFFKYQIKESIIYPNIIFKEDN